MLPVSGKIVATFAALLMASPVLAQSRDEIAAKINSALPSNGRGQITAQSIRDVMNSLNAARGQPNGIAELDAAGRLPSERTPSVLAPEAIQLLGPNSTGDVSKMSVAPNPDATAGTLAKALGDISGFKAPGASGVARLDAVYNVVNSRSLFNSPLSGQPGDWLGNTAGGGPNQYGYGGLGQIVALSGIGDVGITGATRTEDITTSGRFPAAGNFQAFNFKTVNPLTSWGLYSEARRKKGAGQIHGIEANVTDLGDGSDRTIPSAMGAGVNAVYSAWTSALNVACGGNVTTRTLPDGTVVQQQTGWDGEKNVTQAANCGVALPIYANGAKFEKGIIIGDNALVGCDGTGGSKTCTGVEMGRGTNLGWIDGTTRLGASLGSDVSPTGNPLRLRFTDFGAIFDGGGGATLNVIGKSTDVNGIQMLGGGSASAPARLVAAGSANASLGLSAAGLGVVQMQSVMLLTPYTVATLPVCDGSRVGGMAYVTDASSPQYRSGVVGGGTAIVPVFCSGSAWEAH